MKSAPVDPYSLSATQELVLTTHLARDKITRAYKFNFKYDGTLGEEALNFRNTITVWVEKLKSKLGVRYDEYNVKPLLCDALTGAAEKYKSDNALMNIDSVDDYLKWFDKTFNLRNLRIQLFQQLVNWKITPNTPPLKIVD